MIITDHAVENYIKRVLSINDRQAGEGIVGFVEEQIEKAVNEPEMVFVNENSKYGSEVPIHIRNGCAVPVARGFNGDGSIDLRVPTTYNAGTFLAKFDSHEPARAEG